MHDILEIITALGTIVATASIISAFALYRVQKRDEYLAKVRDSLQRLNNNINELDSLLDFELAYELAYALVFSRPTEYSLKNVFSICNELIGSNTNEDTVNNTIRTSLGILGISFHDTISTKYSTLLLEITQSATTFYPKYVGLFRFSVICTTLMRNVFQNYKKVLLNEDILSKILCEETLQRTEKWASFEDFQKHILDRLIAIIEVTRIKHSQKDVNSLRSLVDIIYSCHIQLSPSQWRRLARQNRKISMLPSKQISTLTDELIEIEKCFRTVMTHESTMKYAFLVKSIEITNE